MRSYTLKLFIKDKFVLIAFFVSLGLLAGNFGYLISHIKPLNEGVFLHYDIVIGPNLHGDWWKLYYLPITGAVILILNLIIAYFFYTFDKIFCRTLCFGTIFSELFLLIAAYLLIGINF